jgi:hypothetical protein
MPPGEKVGLAINPTFHQYPYSNSNASRAMDPNGGVRSKGERFSQSDVANAELTRGHAYRQRSNLRCPVYPGNQDWILYRTFLPPPL